MDILRRSLSLFSLALLLSAGRLNAAIPDTFQVTGVVTKPRTWTVQQIQTQFPGQIQTVSYSFKGTNHSAHCLSLLTLLQAAQPNVNPRIKHHLLSFVVFVQGRDGYTIPFTMGELMPDFGNRSAWVALDEDGKPLPDDAGPVELLVPEDKQAARWVHAISTITVTDTTVPVKSAQP